MRFHLAQATSLADVYDALTSERVYKKLIPGGNHPNDSKRAVRSV